MGAADINNLVLVGRLTRDAELKYTQSGQAVSKFSIAVNAKKKDGENWADYANFFDITLWGRQAESLNQYLMKGKRIAVAGSLYQDRWEQNGQNHSKVGVTANNIELLDGGNSDSQGSRGGGDYGGGSADSGGQRSGSGYSGGQGNSQSRSGTTTRENDDGFSDDIPF
ncbi:hypothetical protein FACS189447_10250 [Spirochaetia bacterium]|nr:hypothetical protein FACS189447_10250 [Spirochaetia bacterium]